LICFKVFQSLINKKEKTDELIALMIETRDEDKKLINSIFLMII
jgi:hypothetical protein